MATKTNTKPERKKAPAKVKRDDREFDDYYDKLQAAVKRGDIVRRHVFPDMLIGADPNDNGDED